ncbi:MAG TPA: protein kinase, partial [Gemmatimonadales bacterium]|nr:protein kinase [Gemmatimonadales bacterium]
MTDLRTQLQAGLGSSYTLERELGRGGMATVFLARDLKHDRPVALKVLHPELAASLGAERFLREIRLAASLQHPHILTVLDSGEIRVADGPPILWFTMPFIRGESLRDRLRRETQLPVDDAVRIAREAADALSAAHAEGIIHRDVKPENILLTGNHALVADFGIARLLADGRTVGRSDGQVEDRLTDTGLTLGTPAYMSPEQASGQRELDARTDVYSLAVVLYEMLAGETPFAAPTAQAMIARRFMENARPVRQVREAVPEHVERALQRALARTVADRFASAAEFAAALLPPAGLTTGQPTVATASGAAVPTRPAAPVPGSGAVSGHRRRLPALTLTLVAGILIGLGVLFAWRRTHADGTEASAGEHRIAVLPFENLGDSAQEYFADGVTDAVRGKLSAVSGLQVIASRSSNEYKHSTKSLADIGRELGTDYLLIARIRWAKGADGTSRVEVSPELVRVTPGQPPTTKWQQPFEAAMTDVFQVQGEIAGKVASALDVALGAGQQATLEERPTQNLAAYDAYLKGEASRGLVIKDPPSLRDAITYYGQAVALDSGFALAWAKLSLAQGAYYYNVTPTPTSAEAARLASARALALAPNLPEARLAVGDYHFNVEADDAKSLAADLEGLKLAPDNADLLNAAALSAQGLGRWDEAEKYLEHAVAVDPRSASAARRLAVTLLRLRRYPEALAQARRGRALAPSDLDLIEAEAMVHLAQGDLAGARAVMHDAAATTEPTALVAAFGNYWDLFWVLNDEQQQLLLRLPPSTYDGDRGTWGIIQAQTYYVRGDQARSRIYADSALQGIEAVLRDTPNDPQRRAFLGLALAYLGRKADAIREGERAVALAPATRDGYIGPYL